MLVPSCFLCEGGKDREGGGYCCADCQKFAAAVALKGSAVALEGEAVDFFEQVAIKRLEGKADAVLVAGGEAVEAVHTAGVVHCKGFRVDGFRFARLGAESAGVAFVLVYGYAEKGEAGHEAKQGSRRAEGVAEEPPARCDHRDENSQCRTGSDEACRGHGGEGDVVEGVIVEPCQQACQQVVSPDGGGTEKAACDAPEVAVRV
ncbi:hypothetical protein Barb7_00318 [Bacteroidales bacterium Barb7]|nr:hypothetical protein Barb7_00318 [Bacteroidales bacterium Barb7]